MKIYQTKVRSGIVTLHQAKVISIDVVLLLGSLKSTDGFSVEGLFDFGTILGAGRALLMFLKIEGLLWGDKFSLLYNHSASFFKAVGSLDLFRFFFGTSSAHLTFFNLYFRLEVDGERVGLLKKFHFDLSNSKCKP
jgi:hypothetical protein